MIMNTAQAYGAYGVVGGFALISFLLPAGIAFYIAPNATVGAIAGGLTQQQLKLKFLGATSDDMDNMMAAALGGGVAGAYLRPWTKLSSL